MKFKVQQIDHVEVFVPNRHEAAEWYREILGLEILSDFEDWAKAAGGPLMLSSDGGSTKLALFEDQPRGNRPTAGHHRVAFRTGGKSFLRFLNRANDVPIFDDNGQPITANKPVDHGRAWSVYFCDPYGNRYEITTYDYDTISETVHQPLVLE